jgi:hypothetical protein
MVRAHQGDSMKLIGRIVCLLNGHKRGKLVTVDSPLNLLPYRAFACPRCGRETRYKVKDQSKGTPGDQA